MFRVGGTACSNWWMLLVAEHGAAAQPQLVTVDWRAHPCIERWPPPGPRLLVSSPVSHPELKSFVTGADQRAGTGTRAPSAGLAPRPAAILGPFLLQPQPSGGHCAAAAGTGAGLELRGCWVDARHVVGKGKEQCKVCCSRGCRPAPAAEARLACLCVPLLQFVDSQHPALYRPINWAEFRCRRFAVSLGSTD